MQQTIDLFLFAIKNCRQELLANKLRSFLSILGVTFGIFCILSILTLVGSLKKNIRSELNSLGSNTIFIDKWQYAVDKNQEEYPWWQYTNRPEPKYSEIQLIKKLSPIPLLVAFKNSIETTVTCADSAFAAIKVYAVSPDFIPLQMLKNENGDMPDKQDFEQKNAIGIIGYELAQKIKSINSRIIGEKISLLDTAITIKETIAKQGSQLIGGWDFDNSIIVPYVFLRNHIEESKSDPLILVKPLQSANYQALKESLTGIMRNVRHIKQGSPNNFSLNNINDFTERLNTAMQSLQLGGWAITGLSLIIGMFGIVNIMFVSVNERKSSIGIKKAIGAKKRVILAEILIESVFLCFIGGCVAALMVFVLSKIVSNSFEFPIFISVGSLVISLMACIIVGILAGISPAISAARLSPIEAIKSID